MKYLIVDDEPQARKMLHTFMEEIGGHELAASCGTALEAYQQLQSQQVDVVFLDIQMPGISGIEMMRSIPNMPPVILTTAYSEYALEGFNLNVVDYLLKPISMMRLVQALEKMKRALPSASPTPADHVFLRIDNKFVNVRHEEIILVEGLQNYVKIHLRNKLLVAPYSMKAMEDLLPRSKFMRVHRSYIIAVAEISAIQGNLIELPGHTIPIGVSYKDEVMKRFLR